MAIRLNQSIDLLKTLISAGASASDTYDKEDKAIHVATKTGHLEAVKFFAENQLNEKKQISTTALMMAVAGHEVEIFNYLVSQANIDLNCTFSHLRHP